VRVALDPGVKFWANRVASGGSPWKVVRFAEAAMPFVSSLRTAGPLGAVPTDEASSLVARSLLDRGFAHPVLEERGGARRDVEVVVPVFGPAETLNDCLEALAGLQVIVVDDGSSDGGSLRATAVEHGARFERHRTNRGPAAARNTGARIARAELVAFVDSDCRPRPGWLDKLVPHFDDARVVAVAPRIAPAESCRTVLGRYEACRSALDMGSRPEQVRPGGRLSFVPSAVLVIRRDVVVLRRFDEGLRFGEDVDLVWRLVDDGWLVRYEPAATVAHQTRLAPSAWIGRRYAYGTSAGALARRHPGRLAPARLSGWSVASILLVGAGRHGAALAVTGIAAGLLHRRLAPLGVGPSMAVSTVSSGLVADAAALGHALRREWWPLGALALAAGARPGRAGLVGPARLASLLILGPLVLEWARQQPDLDPLAYVALRLVDDAAYGTGVLAGALAERTMAPLVPEVSLPKGLPGLLWRRH
jgi:mycofactocin glycosyltransferase